MTDSDIEVAELAWERYVSDLKNSGSLDNCLAVSDVSGSMDGIPMMVSISMGLLTASLCSPPFQNVICTFSEKPEFFVVPEGLAYRPNLMPFNQCFGGRGT
jgi:hypothetical protein